MPSVLVIDRPGDFRDALAAAVAGAGAEAHVVDDAIDAFGRLDRLVPDVTVIGDCGAPGPAVTARIVGRKCEGAAVYVLRARGVAETEVAATLDRALGAEAIARAVTAARET